MGKCKIQIEKKLKKSKDCDWYQKMMNFIRGNFATNYIRVQEQQQH